MNGAAGASVIRRESADHRIEDCEYDGRNEGREEIDMWSRLSTLEPFDPFDLAGSPTGQLWASGGHEGGHGATRTRSASIST